MSSSVGKLKNRQSGESLDFTNAPISYHLIRDYDYETEALLGHPAPAVAFRCGGASLLTFSLELDSDADSAQKPASILSFLKALDKIDADTLSVPVVDFQMGRFSFSGYVKRYGYDVLRFDGEGEPNSLKVSFEILSNGEFEGGE